MVNEKLSIIIPAKNEFENLCLLIPQIFLVLDKLKYFYEIIVVDDASDDNTINLLNNNPSFAKKVRIIRLNNHSGQSKALFVGINSSLGNIIITMDGDLQNSPDDLPKMISLFIKNKCDMVTGYRLKRHDSFKKKFSTKVANYIRRKVLHSPIIDGACGFKIFKKECLSKIDYFDGIHRFLPDLFIINNYKVCQIEIDHKPRLSGKTKYGITNRLIQPLCGLMKVKILKNNKKL